MKQSLPCLADRSEKNRDSIAVWKICANQRSFRVNLIVVTLFVPIFSLLLEMCVVSFSERIIQKLQSIYKFLI